MLERSLLPDGFDPFAFAGERWFIDEVGEGYVRLLAAAALDPRPFVELAHLTSHESRASRSTKRARTLVVELESADAAAAWTDEVDRLVPVAPLVALLAARKRHGRFGHPAQAAPRRSAGWLRIRPDDQPATGVWPLVVGAPHRERRDSRFRAARRSPNGSPTLCVAQS